MNLHSVARWICIFFLHVAAVTIRVESTGAHVQSLSNSGTLPVKRYDAFLHFANQLDAKQVLLTPPHEPRQGVGLLFNQTGNLRGEKEAVIVKIAKVKRPSSVLSPMGAKHTHIVTADGWIACSKVEDAFISISR